MKVPLNGTLWEILYNSNLQWSHHGESDKVVNQSKLLMAYDKLLLAGNLAYKRLIEAKLPLRNNQVVFVGRPQVELFLDIKHVKQIKSILYAPTWEGFVEEANYTSISEYGLNLIKSLEVLSNHGIKIYFKPHPFTSITKRNNIQKYYSEIIDTVKKSQIEFIDKNNSIYDYMNNCDLMITDISSVISDFLYTQKPMILTNPKKYSQETLNNDFQSTKALYILNNPANINDLLIKIEQNDYLKNMRIDMKNYILGDIPEGYFNKFNEVINNSIYLKDEKVEL